RRRCSSSSATTDGAGFDLAILSRSAFTFAWAFGLLMCLSKSNGSSIIGKLSRSPRVAAFQRPIERVQHVFFAVVGRGMYRCDQAGLPPAVYELPAQLGIGGFSARGHGDAPKPAQTRLERRSGHGTSVARARLKASLMTCCTASWPISAI